MFRIQGKLTSRNAPTKARVHSRPTGCICAARRLIGEAIAKLAGSGFKESLRNFRGIPAPKSHFSWMRCAFSETRKNVNDGEESPPDAETISARKRATELFERYRKQYPHGRFVADALGWLGALAFDAGSYLDALDCYIAQAETPGHPETLKSAIFMCERSLAAVAATPDGDGGLCPDCATSADRDGIHLSRFERAGGG